LNHELKQLARQREQRRSGRRRDGIPVVAIVGYTNAGKSTLLNTLTGSDVIAENKLFATLDTRSRRLRLPSGRFCVLTDTVGFIRDLPKDLLAAFRATFEEAQEADLLLEVVDASDAAFDQHLDTTERLIVDLELERVPRLPVFNKIDRLPPGRGAEVAAGRGGIATSAIDRASLIELLGRIDAAIAPSPSPDEIDA
jgi:GTP-binding protein HflX